MRRALLSRRALLAAGASLALPVRARAQTSAQLVAEVDRFRAVMPNLAANVALRRGDDALRHLRVARREEGLELLEPRESAALWTGAEPAEDMSARLIAAFCACGPLDASVGALGYTLERTHLGMDVLETEDGQTLIHLVGGALASVELEAGIARPRALHIGRGPTAWSVRAVRYAEVTQGWFPERLEVFRGDAPEATWAVLDAARTVGGLSPLPTLAPQAPARLPWLPL